MTKLSPQQQRQQDARAKKLEEIKQAVDSGSLTVRQMTPEERAKYPKPPPRPEGAKGRRPKRAS